MSLHRASGSSFLDKLSLLVCGAEERPNRRFTIHFKPNKKEHSSASIHHTKCSFGSGRSTGHDHRYIVALVTPESQDSDFDLWQGHMCFTPVIGHILPTFQGLSFLYLQTERRLHLVIRKLKVCALSIHVLHQHVLACDQRMFSSWSSDIYTECNFWTASYKFYISNKQASEKNLYIYI